MEGFFGPKEFWHDKQSKRAMNGKESDKKTL